MRDFKKSSLYRLAVFAVMFCFTILFATVNVSFAGPFGLFPNFHPLRTAGRVATAPLRAAGFGGCGSGAEARYERRQARRDYGSCANGACQAPTQAPAKQVQAPPPRK